jgi:bacterioferritin (cytochrome b1)
MNEKNVIKILSDLVALDFDAIDAYDQAIARLREDNVARVELSKFRADHERHVRDLAPIVSRMGSMPPTKGDFLRFLTQGKVVIGALGGDQAILRAMKSNEDTTNRKYEDSLGTPGLDEETRVILQRNLADERRHRAWIESRIAFKRAAA